MQLIIGNLIIMKNILLILFFAPSLLFAQKVKNENSDQTGDLKDFSGKYCTIVIQRSIPLIKELQTDSDTWNFVDSVTGGKLKLKSVTAVINYMELNGWQLTNTFVDVFEFMIFKKKE